MAEEDSHALEQTDFHHHKTGTDQGKIQRTSRCHGEANVFKRGAQRNHDRCRDEYQ